MSEVHDLIVGAPANGIRDCQVLKELFFLGSTESIK
jgi:hypothetical protein